MSLFHFVLILTLHLTFFYESVSVPKSVKWGLTDYLEK